MQIFKTSIQEIGKEIRRFFQVLYTACLRFYWDDCFSRASALAYTTLFALVPMFAIGFYMLPFLGFNENQMADFMRDLLAQLLPSVEIEALGDFQENTFIYIQQFRSNIGSLNTLSAFALIISSIALVNTIESAVNAIWRVTSSRTTMAKIITFWAILTLGPALIAVSVLTTTKLTAYAQEAALIEPSLMLQFSAYIPIVLAWFAFTVLYLRMPSTTVRLRDAAFGGLIAAILFDLVKMAFAYYVRASATYSTMYGVFAFLPLLLLWIYSFWVVILLGAELSYQSGSIKVDIGRKKYSSDLGEIGGILGLRLLQIIGKRFQRGETPPSESELAIELGTDPTLIRTSLDILTKSGILTVSDEETNSRSFLISPTKLTIEKIIQCFMGRGHQIEKEQGLLAAFEKTFSKSKIKRPFLEWTLDEFLLAEES